MKSIKKNHYENVPQLLPVIPTMDIVVFPNQIVPLLVLDQRIISGINQALEQNEKLILLLASRKDTHNGTIGTSDLYDIGTTASIMRVINITEGGMKILVQGISRSYVKKIVNHENILQAVVEPLLFEAADDKEELEKHISNLKELADHISSSSYVLGPDFHLILSKMHDPEKIGDFILSHLNLSVEQAQLLLSARNQIEFLKQLHFVLSHELEANQLQENIKNQARDSMNRSQKEFFLREQLRAIKKELGDDDYDEIAALREQAHQAELSPEARIEVDRQLNRLEKTSPDSMEAAVTRNHIDWVLALPWGKFTKDDLDISRAKTTLDEDHYGIQQVKERILDYMSIRKLKSDGDVPILCFVGPPGTGKTSLGKSIARALGRNYFRISFGGCADEAEVRGHRRTYVGAMPGRFIQGVRKAGSLNPVIIIDELDKIGADFRGDPSAAMLEVLDPQQNNSFYDNYLGIPFDLSHVLFIATANTTESISAPLRDRLEIIELSGYTIEEKLKIAKTHLVASAKKDAGLEEHGLTLSDNTLLELISSYTRESGVRNLERSIKRLCAKAARVLIEKGKTPRFTRFNIHTYLGPKRFLSSDEFGKDDIGISNGLAWTATGGEVIKVEAVIMPGKGKLLLTGSLGNVMQESAQAALSYIRAHAREFNINPDMFAKYDLHVHVPSGAVPKDGPSAGVTLLSSLISTLTNRPISASYAMTGELNLRGNIMPIGGVKEKILAAKRHGVQHVILPELNRNDLVGETSIAKDIKLIWVSHASQVLETVLLPLKK